MNRTIVLIGIGGLPCSIPRYLTASLFTEIFPSHFPYGTFIVNVVGCLLDGIICGPSERYKWLTADFPYKRILRWIAESVVKHFKVPVLVVPSK